MHKTAGKGRVPAGFQRYALRRSFRTQRPAGRSIGWIEHWQTARGAGGRKYETPWSVISSLRRNNVPAALIRRDTFSRLNTAPPNREMVAVRSRDNVWLPFFVRDSKAICGSLSRAKQAPAVGN